MDLRKGLAVGVGAAVAASVFATPALAASFKFQAKFSSGLKSRTYTADHEGKHKFIKLKLKCVGPPMEGTYMQARLVHEVGFGPDDIYGWKKIPCKKKNKNRTRKWDSGRDDEFHYDIRREQLYGKRADTNWKLWGKAKYPS